MKKSFLILSLTLFFSLSYSQIYFGAEIAQISFKQKEDKVYGLSNVDYSLDLKYQWKKINVSGNWSMLSRINNGQQIQSNQFSILARCFPIQEDKIFVPHIGLGTFVRIPYDLPSGIEKFYNMGIVSDVGINFMQKIGYLTIGAKHHIDLFNSQNKDEYKLIDYGFYLGATLHLNKVFKK